MSGDHPTTAEAGSDVRESRQQPESPRRSFLKSKLLLAGLLLVLAAIMLTDRFALQAPHEQIYEECQEILSQASALADRQAPPAEWDALDTAIRERVTPLLDELTTELKRRPSNPRSASGDMSEDRVTQFIRRPLLQIGRYDLPRLVTNGRSGKPLEFERIEKQLRQARNALDAIRLGGETSEQ